MDRPGTIIYNSEMRQLKDEIEEQAMNRAAFFSLPLDK